MKRLSITYRAICVYELPDFSSSSTGVAVIEEAQSGYVTSYFPTFLLYFFGSILLVSDRCTYGDLSRPRKLELV